MEFDSRILFYNIQRTTDWSRKDLDPNNPWRVDKDFAKQDWATQEYHEYPDIQWLGPFSTGLYRYHQVFFHIPCGLDEYSENWEKYNNLNIKIIGQDEKNAPIFSLYKVPEAQDIQESYDGQNWSDINSCLSDSINIRNISSEYQKETDQILLLYKFILVCKSDVEGEFVVDVSIGGKLYRFGASFHNENESLKINLANKGTEIPDLVSRSFYRSDPYEEKPDWVLLNNKYKELLMNYLDVLDNKGSYKSLQNALDWFGYEDKVKLKEIWKYETPDGTKMYEADIQKEVTDQIKEWMFNRAKTTHMSLVSALRVPDNSRVSETPAFQATEYSYYPTQTDTESVVATWTEEEMRLKMVLLGNFLETYFFPIHLNLFRSVLENIEVFADTYIQNNAIETTQEECYTEAGELEVSWSSDQLVEGENSSGFHSRLVLDLDEVHVIAGLARPEPYGQAFENTTPSITQGDYKGLPYIPIIACHEIGEDSLGVDDKNVSLSDIQTAFSRQVFHGIGATALASLSFPEKIVSGTCETNVHGDFMVVRFQETNLSNHFSVRFLFQHPGNFVMLWRFVGESGRSYSKKVDISIRDNLKPDVSIQIMTTPYEVYKPGAHNFILPNPFNPSTPVNLSTDPITGAGYMWARTKEMNYETIRTVDKTGNQVYQVDLKGDWGYTQYIPLRPYRDDTDIPENAPFRTPVYTARFEGTGCLSRMDKFIKKFLQKQSIPNPDYQENLAYLDEDKPEDQRTPENIDIDFYYRTGVDTHYLEDGSIDESYEPAWCWVQYIHPVRGLEISKPENIGTTEFQSWYRKDIFIPEFMNLSKPDSIVPDYYPIVCIPMFKLYKTDENGDYVVKPVPYSYHVDESRMEYMWEFYSWNLHQNIGELSKDIQDPFLAWNYNQPLPPGYYTITFRYNFGSGVQKIVKPTPFKLVNV